MPKLTYYEYIVLYHFKPVRDNAQNDITPDSKVIVPSTQVLALDDKTVGKIAARKIPAVYEEKGELNQCEVLVRPFAP